MIPKNKICGLINSVKSIVYDNRNDEIYFLNENGFDHQIISAKKMLPVHCLGEEMVNAYLRDQQCNLSADVINIIVSYFNTTECMVPHSKWITRSF